MYSVILSRKFNRLNAGSTKKIKSSSATSRRSGGSSLEANGRVYSFSVQRGKLNRQDAKNIKKVEEIICNVFVFLASWRFNFENE
jgi:hypothetical protein